MSALAISQVSGSSIAACLSESERDAEGAYAENTRKGWRQDSAHFGGWCLAQALRQLPAEPETVARYVRSTAEDYAPATIARRLSTIARMHRMAGLPSPTEHQKVKLAMRAVWRAKGRAQRQARGLTLDHRNRMIAAARGDVAGLRDRALLAVAYDTACRRSELVALECGDLDFLPDGSAIAAVRRSKTDQEGAGMTRFLAPDTVEHVRAWLEAAAIAAGPLFRSIRKGGRIGDHLSDNSVPRIFKRMASEAGIDGAGDFSGHSTRVGFAQDATAAGVDIAAIMQAAGWQTPEMVARYTRNLTPRRGGAAKLAALQGRI